MIEQRFDSVWDAIEPTPAEAANMKARAELMIAVAAAVEGWDLARAQSAQRLAVSLPRLNDLMKGRITKFSLDALMRLAAHAGLAVRVEVTKAAA